MTIGAGRSLSATLWFAAVFYRARLGFAVQYQDSGFAELARAEAELHLWAVNDDGWAERARTWPNSWCAAG